MPGLNKNRKRPITLAFRVSHLEAKKINERIKISGLPRGKYFIRTFQNQQIEISVGKFESDRLSLEFKRLRELLESLDDNETIKDVVEDCKALMEELKPFFPLPKEVKKIDIDNDVFNYEDTFSDIEIF